ncbi:MAG: Flagellar hook protein FlgE [Pseudomonadota bacterium]|jgi:flagellar hook-basal body protein
MSFYTSLTGLNAATTQLSVTSNNIANVSTTGFKRSRADFGDIFATSPLQKASSVIGQGVSLKRVSQEFSQGNIQFSANSLDIAITGDGFFPLKSADSLQDIYTRNGTFLLNDSYAVVNSAGQALMAATVDSSGKADLSNLKKLIIPRSTVGDAEQTSNIELGLNLPADANVITAAFNANDPNTYNLTTAVTVFDQGGNEYLAKVYYVKTQVATPEDPFNKWQTHVYIGDTKLEEMLIQATEGDQKLFVNKYGEIRPESEINPSLINGGVSKLFNLDDLSNPQQSVPATATGAVMSTQLVSDWKSGFVPMNYTGVNPVTASTLNTVSTSVTTRGVVPTAGSLTFTAGAGSTVTASFAPTVGTAQTATGTLSADRKTLTFSGSPMAEPGKSFSITTSSALASGDAMALTLKANSLDFTLNVDGSADPVTVKLNHLIDSDADITKKYTGVEIAREITNAIAKAYGDERYFDFSSLKATTAATNADLFKIAMVNTGAAPSTTPSASDGYKTINVTDAEIVTLFGTGKTMASLTSDEASALLQSKLRTALSDSSIQVAYDPVLKSFTFKTATVGKEFVLTSATTNNNDVFKLTTSETRPHPDTGAYEADMFPRGDTIRATENQRFGISVSFDDTSRLFQISSGTTGDTSSVSISNASAVAKLLFGLPLSTENAALADTSSTPLRGITSKPAVLQGNTIGINVNNKFRVDGSNNQFVVTVNNVTGIVTMPEKADYTIEEFRKELEFRINSLADSFGRTVSGVKVQLDRNALGQSFFKFTTGNAGNDAFLKVSANSIWGMADLESARGTTSRWVEPPQARNAAGFPLYVNREGLETSDPGDFSELETADLWSAIFLDKGELTFSTDGNLKSPVESIKFKASTIGETGATLQFAINYDGSTQYSSPFSVLAQSQNGRPEGDLIGLNIGDDGLVSANYSNGTQKNLAKIILANFTAPTGLRQLGDSSYLATSQSGKVTLGEAGAAGFGTVRAGATERANVDLTQELIELITAQRNFQANAKAIETNNTLTQAIINIRS